jgi:cephalosporin hydroxylase
MRQKCLASEFKTSFEAKNFNIGDFESEVLREVNTKRTILWDVKPRNIIEVHRRFGGTYCLHF